MWAPLLIIIGTLPPLYGCLSYAKETIRGKNKPNRVSWLLWSIAPLIATAAAIQSGVTWAVIPIFIAGFGCLFIFGASFLNRKAYWKLTAFDYLCGTFSALALILWGATKNPNLAIFFSILGDTTAALPTLKKAWNNPHTETYGPYIGGSLSVITGFFAMTAWNFAYLAFPIYLLCMNTALISAVYHGNKLTPKH